jgi:uncharacterized protein YjbI with pentapeptide repeats
MKKNALLLTVLIILSGCSNTPVQNTMNSKPDFNSEKVSSTSLKGRAEFPSDNFKTKATVTDAATKSTVSIIYPADYPVTGLRNVTAASGITDDTGNFEINPDSNFNPSVNDIFVLEATKKISNNIISVRTYIKRTASGWSSITTSGIKINSKTTALAVIDSLKTGINPVDTIGNIDAGGNPSAINNGTATVSIAEINEVAGLVILLLTVNNDSVQFISYQNGAYSIKIDNSNIKDILINTNKCIECNLINKDLSSLNLSNSVLTGANLTLANLGNINLTGSDLTNANLSEANLTNANLNGATMAGTSIAKTTLTGVNLTGVNLTTAKGASGTVKDFTGFNFTNAVLNNANLSGATMSNAVLTGASVTGINLQGVSMLSILGTGGLVKDFSNFNFTDANLTSAGFSQANMTGANLTNANLTSANISSAIMNNANLANATLTSALVSGINFTGAVNLKTAKGTTGAVNNFSNFSFVNAIMTGQDLTNSILSGASFSNAVMTDVIITGATVTGTNFQGANMTLVKGTGGVYNNFSNFNFSTSVLTNVNMGGANLTNANFSGATITNLVLTGASVTGINLSGENLVSTFGTGNVANNFSSFNFTNANFTNSVLSNINLTSANLTNANLTNSNLTNATINGANLTGANLTGATITGLIKNSTTNFSGATWIDGHICAVSSMGNCN